MTGNSSKTTITTGAGRPTSTSATWRVLAGRDDEAAGRRVEEEEAEEDRDGEGQERDDAPHRLEPRVGEGRGHAGRERGESGRGGRADPAEDEKREGAGQGIR